MIDGFNDMLSQSDSLHDMARKNDRAVLIALANKIRELENRIDKMESQKIIDDFERMQRKDTSNELY